MANSKFQRPTALLMVRNRSESPKTRSRSRPMDLVIPPAEGENCDFDTLQNELEKQSGIFTINNERISTQMDDFVNEGLLGAGTCSAVYKMRHRTRPELVVAVKHMRRSSNCQDENKRIMMDLTVVTKSHDCAYIVQCFGIFFTTDEVWICMEVMCTCLDKLLRELHRPFPEKVVGKITISITTALAYLKSEHNVMHRDIKPSNMLLSYNGVVKLCDFGISGKLKDSIARSRQLGCIGYMAPERLGTPMYDVRADVWSLGISLLELATGSFPYTGTEIEFAIMSKIISDPPPSLPHHIPFTPQFRQFIDLCLKKDHTKRPKYNYLMTTEFFRRYNAPPYDVLRWLRGLPLPHLHVPNDTTINTINYSSDRSYTTLSTSPSLNSTNRISSNADLALDLNAHHEYTKAPLLNESVATCTLSDTVDVTLVAAPMFTRNKSSPLKTTSSNSSNDTTKDSNTSRPATDFVHSSTCQHNCCAKKISSTEYCDFMKARILKASPVRRIREPQSQSSSGYGSTGSDSSIGDTRYPNTSQLSDLFCVNGSTAYPNITEISRGIGTVSIKSDIPVVTSKKSVKQDTIVHTAVPDDANNSVSVYSNLRTKLASQTVLYGTVSHTSKTTTPSVNPTSVSGAFSTEQTVSNSTISGEKKNIVTGTRPPHVNRYAGPSQARSASVGHRVHRANAQRWPSKPSGLLKQKTDGTSDQSSERVAPRNELSINRLYQRETPSNNAISPQQYHHHYFYYYYDQDNNDNSSIRTLTPPLQGTRSQSVDVGKNLRHEVGKLMTDSCAPSGRMTRRLATHPVPRNNNISSAIHSNNVSPSSSRLMRKHTRTYETAL